MVLSTTWLVLYRPQLDAKRVDVKRVDAKAQTGQSNIESPKGEADGLVNGLEESTKTVGLKYRGKVRSTSISNGGPATGHSGDRVEYYWQSYPDNFADRFYWVSDLLINFRLPGWNLAISPLPALPPFVKAPLGEPVDAKSISGVSSTGLQRHDTRAELIRATIPKFVFGYFVMDLLKVVMMKDPYFTFGPTSYAPPWYLQGYSPWALYLIRQALNSVAILVSLEMAFLLPVVFIGVIGGPGVFGLRAEPWYWLDRWGSWSNITDKGLGGLWGGWWHQTFRFEFSAPVNFCIRKGYVQAKSPASKLLALFSAFAISGFMHYCGSISQFPRTHLWHAPIFFMSQAVGIATQMALCAMLQPLIKSMPQTVRRSGNFAFVFAWLLCTAWWLTDDFARGGIWLYEAIPISPLRGLGFGVEGDGWWCWEHFGVGWYTGKHWWESGIAL